MDEALQRGGSTHTREDVWALIEEGLAQLWSGPNAVLVTQIDRGPQAKSLCFWIAAGAMPEIAAMLPGILAWARDEGCTRAVFVGRRGWERAFVTRGWRFMGIVMERDL